MVATAGGLRLRGTTAAGTREFLGIPYAAPPVGKLRWRPPRPPRAGRASAATSFAPQCPQLGVSVRRGQHVRELPVPERLHAAAGAALRHRPVMVWIHGGALVTGESDDYNPAGWSRGVVVVTINYRLGALGFLADSSLASPPGGSVRRLRADGPAGRAALGAAQHPRDSAATRAT